MLFIMHEILKEEVPGNRLEILLPFLNLIIYWAASKFTHYKI